MKARERKRTSFWQIASTSLPVFNASHCQLYSILGTTMPLFAAPVGYERLVWNERKSLTDSKSAPLEVRYSKVVGRLIRHIQDSPHTVVRGIQLLIM